MPLPDEQKLAIARRFGVTSEKILRRISGDTAAEFEQDLRDFVDDLSPEHRANLGIVSRPPTRTPREALATPRSTTTEPLRGGPRPHRGWRRTSRRAARRSPTRLEPDVTGIPLNQFSHRSRLSVSDRPRNLQIWLDTMDRLGVDTAEFDDVRAHLARHHELRAMRPDTLAAAAAERRRLAAEVGAGAVDVVAAADTVSDLMASATQSEAEVRRMLEDATRLAARHAWPPSRRAAASGSAT